MNIYTMILTLSIICNLIYLVRRNSNVSYAKKNSRLNQSWSNIDKENTDQKSINVMGIMSNAYSDIYRRIIQT